MGDEMVATGGIALLCDNLLQRDQPEANKLQAAVTIATLSASPVNAVAIAEAAGAVDGDCARSRADRMAGHPALAEPRPLPAATPADTPAAACAVAADSRPPPPRALCNRHVTVM